MVSYHLLTLLAFILLPHAHSETCRDLHDYDMSPEEICKFTHNTTDCHISDGGFINYTQEIYCAFDVHNLFSLGIIIYVFWLLQLLVGQASCVDNFFCPALVSMAKTMHMTDNLAGVTILSFGQAANTVFAAIAGVMNAKGSDFGLPLGALLGEALLITTVVAGLVTFRATPSPFEMVRRPFFRDVGFLMLTVLIVFYIIYDGCITFGKSLGLLFLYIGYAIVVLTGRMIYVSRRNKKKRKLAKGSSLEKGDTSTITSFDNCNKVDLEDMARDSGLESGDTSTTSSTVKIPDPNLKSEDSSGDTARDLSLESGGNSTTITSLNDCNKGDPGDTARDSSMESVTLEAPEAEDKIPDYGLNGHLSFDNPMQKLVYGLIPIDLAAFREARWYIKAYHVFRSPFRVILLFTIPRVDIEVYNHGWNRYLNVLHVALSPSICMLLTEGTITYWGSFPIVIFVLLLSILFALVVFFTSKNEQQPIYHRVFAFYTFAIGVLWISAFSNEIVNIFMTLGVLFNLSSSVLGFTLLAWGNCIGDLIAEPLVAKQGYPQIGYTATFSEPLFFTLMGIGLPFTLTFASSGINEVFPITFMLIQVILVTGLLTSLTATLILVPLQRFKVGKIYGGILILIYVVFLALGLLVEAGQITGTVVGNKCGR